MSALDLFASALGAFILITIVLFPFFPNTGDSPERVFEVRQEMNEIISQLNQQLETAQAQASTAEAAAASAQASADAVEQQSQQQSQQLQQAQAELAAALSTSNSIQQATQQCESSLQQSTSLLSDAEESLQSCRAASQQTFVLVVISWPSEDDVDLHVIDPAGNEFYYNERTFPGTNAAFEEDSIKGPGNELWLSPSAMQGEYSVYIKMYNKVVDDPVAVRGSVMHQSGRTSLPATTLRQTDEKPLVARFRVDDEGNVTIL